MAGMALVYIWLGLIAGVCGAVTSHTRAANSVKTAICISGTPRNQGRPISANLSEWPDAVVAAQRKRFQPKIVSGLPSLSTAQLDAFQFFAAGNVTISSTVHHFLYPSLHQFDVFMYVPTSLSGDVGRARAERACAHYAPRDTKNRIFCAGGPDIPMNASNIFSTEQDFDWLTTESGWPPAKVLQQYRGRAMCNAMIQDVANREGSDYKWILWIRADLAFLVPFPPLSSFTQDKDIIFIYHDSDRIYFGMAGIMHGFLNKIWTLGQLMPLLQQHMASGFTPQHIDVFWVKHAFGGYLQDFPAQRGCHPYRDHRDRWRNPHWFPTTPDTSFAHELASAVTMLIHPQ